MPSKPIDIEVLLCSTRLHTIDTFTYSESNGDSMAIRLALGLRR